MLDFESKKIVIGPSWYESVNLSAILNEKNASVLGFFDKSEIICGKRINGIEIIPYRKIKEILPDYIIVVPPISHKTEVMNQIYELFEDLNCKILIFNL